MHVFECLFNLSIVFFAKLLAYLPRTTVFGTFVSSPIMVAQHTGEIVKYALGPSGWVEVLRWYTGQMHFWDVLAWAGDLIASSSCHGRKDTYLMPLWNATDGV